MIIRILNPTFDLYEDLKTVADSFPCQTHRHELNLDPRFEKAIEMEDSIARQLYDIYDVARQNVRTVIQ